MSDALSAQLRRLAVSTPLIRRQVVVGVFQLLQSGKGGTQKAIHETVSTFLSHVYEDVVAEGVTGLLNLCTASVLTVPDAVQLLLTALDTAGAAAAQVLVEGVFDAFVLATRSGTAPPWRWSNHPLILAVQAHPAAITQLLPSCTRTLAAAAERRPPAPPLPHLWAALTPFLAHLLLHQHAPRKAPTAPAAAPLHLAAPQLHADLARLAATHPTVQPLVACLLTRLLQLYSYQEAATRTWVLAALPDLIDVAEVALFQEEDAPPSSPPPNGSSGEAQLEALAAALVHVAVEVGREGHTLLPVLSALQRLQTLHPPALLPHLAPLAALALTTAPTATTRALLALLHSTLTHPTARAPATCPAAAPQLLLLVAVQNLALGSDPRGRQWAGHLLAAVKARWSLPAAPPSAPLPLLPSTTPPTPPPLPPSSATICYTAHAQALLAAFLAPSPPTPSRPPSAAAPQHPLPSFLYGPQGATRWLAALEEAVLQQRLALAEQATSGSVLTMQVLGPKELATSQTLHPSFLSLLAALLGHPAPAVRTAAARAARQVALLSPAACLGLLPVLLFHLQVSTSAAAAGQLPALISGGQKGAAAGPGAASELLVALLQFLPALGGDAAVQPFALRALQPLMAPGAPEQIQCLGLRLLADMWATTRRGWPRLEAALNGLAAPGADLPLSLRLTRAALTWEVCSGAAGRETGRGVALVPAVQAALADPDPTVEALGLQAVAALCQEDDLDFYKAWKVVARTHPTLPPAPPRLAAAWVALLAHGARDAKAHPDRAVAIVEMLWAAAASPAWEVRQAAYEALAQYPQDLLEELEAARPPAEAVALLVGESHPVARHAAESLVATALEHEHSQRRRFLAAARGGGGGGGKSAAAATTREEAALRHRLHHTLPRQLAPTSRPGAPAAACPIATLLCYRPAPSTPGATGQASGGSWAGGEAGQLLRDAVQRGVWSKWTHPFLALHAYTRFFTRWLKAPGSGGLPAAAQLVSELREGAGPAEAEGWPLAAAGLCRAAGGGDQKLLAEAVEKLQEQVAGGRSYAAVRAAAAALAAVAEQLHPTDWQGRRAVVACLAQAATSHPSGSVRAACVEGLSAVACQVLGSAANSRHPQAQQLLSEALTPLTALLQATPLPLPTALLPLAHQAWSSFLPITTPPPAPTPLPDPSQAALLTPPLIAATTTALLATTPLTHPHLTSALWDAHMTSLPDRDPIPTTLPPASPAELQGICQGLSQLALLCYRSNLVNVDQLNAAVDRLQQLVGDGSRDADTRGRGAEALGALVAGCLGEGVQVGVKEAVDVLLVAAEGGGEGKVGGGAAGLGGSMLRAGAVAGLGRLMGSGGGLPGAIQASLLAAPEHHPVARLCLRALEAAALKEPDTRVSSPAALILATACDESTKQPGSGGGASGEAAGTGQGAGPAGAGSKLVPLSVYPEDGALRPLAEWVLGAAKAGGQQDVPALSAAIRCLAGCPRLAAADWAGTCRRLLRSSSPEAGAGQELVEAVLQLACSHGGAPSLDFGVVLDELLTPACFGKLQSAHQEQLLRNIVSVLAALAASRAANVLASLPTLLPGLSSPTGLPLYIAAWQGLSAAATAATETADPMDSKDMVAALHTAVEQLFSLAPALPQLLAGEVLWLAKAAADDSKRDAERLTGSVGLDRDGTWDAELAGALSAWRSMLACLQVLPVDLLLRLTASEDKAPVAALCTAQARALLVLSGRLGFRDLEPCRTFAASCADDAAAASVSVMYSQAVLQAPQSSQVHILLETLRTAEVCAKPDRAVQLAALLVGALQTNVMLPATTVDGSLTLCSPQAAVETLPYGLVRLLASKPWQAAMPAVTTTLVSVMQLPGVSDIYRQQVKAALAGTSYGLDVKGLEALVNNVLDS